MFLGRGIRWWRVTGVVWIFGFHAGGRDCGIVWNLDIWFPDRETYAGDFKFVLDFTEVDVVLLLDSQ